jgi:hypothetical protein
LNPKNVPKSCVSPLGFAHLKQPLLHLHSHPPPPKIPIIIRLAMLGDNSHWVIHQYGVDNNILAR